jgi:hypothetical protein
MSAWDDVQTEPVKEIEAAIFRQMEGRSNSDPCSPWADLALALCQRLAAETKLREEAEREVERLEGDRDRWVAKFAEADRLTLGIVRERDDAQARATRAEGARDAARALLFDLAAAVRLLEEIGAPVSPLAKMRRINAEDLLGEKATPAIPPRYDFRTKRAARAAGEAQKATAP